MINTNLLNELRKLLKWKKSSSFYAQRLGIPETEVVKMLTVIKENEIDESTDTDTGPKLVDERVDGDTIQVQYRSSTPLNKAQIESLYGIDNITTSLSTYWNKETASGRYIISANIKCHTPGMTKEDIETSLRAAFPKDIKPYDIPFIGETGEIMLTILISDDHCGMVNETNTFNTADFTPEVYKARLLQIVSSIEHLNIKFDEIRVISLGDQMQGWNKQTTRGGHIVNAVSNKDQFDFYTQGRAAFYDALFTSELANTYYVHEMENSNHSGLGFSYMANKYLQMYIAARFPKVTFTSHNSLIDGFEYGQHIVLFTHGKDEKFQKRAMPYNINERTDLYVYDWLNTHGYNPTHINATFYKGDLHTFGLQMGKFGRYVNIPAISGNSDYGDMNFGNTKPGALLEVYEKRRNSIITTPIWM